MTLHHAPPHHARTTPRTTTAPCRPPYPEPVWCTQTFCTVVCAIVGVRLDNVQTALAGFLVLCDVMVCMHCSKCESCITPHAGATFSSRVQRQDSEAVVHDMVPACFCTALAACSEPYLPLSLPSLFFSLLSYHGLNNQNGKALISSLSRLSLVSLPSPACLVFLVSLTSSISSLSRLSLVSLSSLFSRRSPLVSYPLVSSL
jgi:hypothetical protein